MRPPKIKDIKWDVKKGHSVYTEVYTHRLANWISTGRIKKDEVMVWRGGLSGWVKPEELSELIPCFEQWEAKEQRKKRKKRVVIQRKKEIKSILVIDDEEGTCRLLNRLLNKKYEVNTVTRGQSGINLVKREKPDLVLLDLKLKDMDGLSVLSKIKKASPQTVVTIISAYGDEDVRKDAKDYGAFSFLDKPLYEKKIFNTIKKVTSKPG